MLIRGISVPIARATEVATRSLAELRPVEVQTSSEVPAGISDHRRLESGSHIRRLASIWILGLLPLLAGVAVAAPAPVATAAASPVAASPDPSAPWLAISDVHYGPAIGGSKTSQFGADTNDALLSSMLAEAHRVDPNPPLVVISGDFLAHHFHNDIAAATVAGLAQRFDDVFPHAQFLITLGNNDSDCGDYLSPVDGPFLATVAKAWEPLVDRNGAAPDFAKTFAHDGSYVATLPRKNLRAVVLDDVPFTVRYAPSCAGNQDAGNFELTELRSRLASFPPASHAWLLLHVPPGIDAYTTMQLAQHLVVVPFTLPHRREALEAIVEDPKNHVTLAIAGHTHKFGYRVLSGKARVPMLLVPSVSPIYYNNPSFLTLAVDGAGTVVSVREHSLERSGWTEVGDFASLGVRSFDAAELLALQARLAKSPELRARYSRLYSGGGFHEITEANWRGYWCASTEFSASAYQSCMMEHGIGVLTPRGVRAVTDGLKIVLVGIVALGIIALLVFFRARSSASRERNRSPYLKANRR